jgi:hypothetical protein
MHHGEDHWMLKDILRLKRTETVELNEAAGKTETKYMYCK